MSKTPHQIATETLEPIARQAFPNQAEYDAAVDALAFKIAALAHVRATKAVEQAGLGYPEVIKALRKLVDPATLTLSVNVLEYVAVSPSDLAELVRRREK